MFYHITVRLQIFCTLLISSSYRTVSSAILGNIFRVSHILQLISRAFRRVKYRSSTPEVFCKEGTLRNFAKFTIKHLCHSLFFNKVAGVRPATLLKKRPWHRYFPVNFAKFLRTPFPTEHLRWLLLYGLQHIILQEQSVLSDVVKLFHSKFKGALMQILPIYSNSYKNNTLKISHSQS